MNNNISIISLFTLMILGVVACVDDFDHPPLNTVPEDMKLDIEDVYQIYQDSGENYQFTEDYMLYATVIMDDSKGNIYKEAYVQDETGGINLYRLSTAGAVHTGEYVRINLNKATIVDYSGKLELVFDEILEIETHIVVQKENNNIEPAVTTIPEVMSGEYDCELIKLNDVQFAESELNNTYADANGASAQNRTLENCDGQSIIVRTSDYADFARDSLPKGNGDITGVITKFQYSGGDIAWQLLIRTTDEVNLDGPRCGETN
ncbi:MAG: DUF5689 domain-containing protein [Bacteroidales bacterium]